MSPRRREPDRWPWPADTALERARRVAQAYRNALLEYAEPACRMLDVQMRTYGQGWVSPRHDTYTDDDQLNTADAADYLLVQPRTIDEYRRLGLPALTTPDGVRYRVGDLRQWATDRRRARSHE